MSNQLFANNASSALASGITSTATSLSVSSGNGALFPSPTGSDWFIITIIKNADPTTREIVKVTSVSTDTFTIVRGQEGTTALAWAAGDLIELRTTAGGLLNMAQKDDIADLSTIYIDNFGNTFFSYNATYVTGTGWTYTANGYATQLSYNTTGQTIFRHAVSGTAGAVISWVQGPYIDANGALKSYKGVATGYTRISPNECIANTSMSPSSFSSTGNVTLSAPSGANFAKMRFDLRAAAHNVANTFRYASVQAYAPDGTTLIDEVQVGAEEISATTAGTILAENYADMLIPVNSSGNVVVKYSTDAGGSSAALFMTIGYYD